jgi:hypothetical protein
MFQEVVRWMLQRDLLVTLHLRVRIVVPASLKARVRHRREELRGNRWRTDDSFRPRRHRARADSGGSEGDFGLFDELPWYTRRAPGSQHNGSSIREVIEPPILEEGIELDEEIDEDEGEESSDEVEAASRGEEEDEEEEDSDNETSILADPGRATAAQRRWLQAMSEGKDELVTRRFDKFVTQHVYRGDLGLMVWFTGLINTSMASALMMRYCFGRKYLGDSCVKSYTYMMNT